MILKEDKSDEKYYQIKKNLSYQGKSQICMFRQNYPKNLEFGWNLLLGKGKKLKQD